MLIDVFLSECVRILTCSESDNASLKNVDCIVGIISPELGSEVANINRSHPQAERRMVKL